EGLKSFTCDLTVSVSDVYKKNLLDLGADQKLVDALDGHKMLLSVLTGGKNHITVVKPAPTGDSNFDDELKRQLLNIAENLKPVVDTWVGDVFKPGFDEDSFKNDCTVTNGSSGFTVVERNAHDGSILRMDYDPQAKLSKVTGMKNGITLLTVETNYSLQTKGYQLDSYSSDMSKANLVEADSFYYGNVGGFILPMRIVKRAEMPPMVKKGTSITFDFSNYRLNQ
ncbi:MAG TPA: hypothetical protein VJ873_00075, partial [bacterium]|nr:hypothetical protein [bacterium]